MDKSVEIQLAERGMRLATVNEAGWFVIVWKDGDTIKVWATDI